VYELDEGQPGTVFASGEPAVYDDVRTIEDPDGELGPVRSAMYFPIGVHGTLTVASTTVDAFDENDRQVAALLAINAAADSGIRYVRFVVLSAAFTLVVLAATVGISAATRTVRTAFALAAALALALVLGIDTALVAGLASGAVPEDGLAVLLALSPNSAFRGLVLSNAVGVVGGADVSAGNSLLNALGLLGWWLGSLSIALWRVWPAVEPIEG
jgi:hypothetical protein